MVYSMESIEERVFKNSILDENALLKYGFQKINKYFQFEKLFYDDTFKAIIKVSTTSVVIGTVFDLENNEKYYQLNNKEFNGKFVNSVRKKYTELLEDIKKKCFNKTYFNNIQANRIQELIYKKYMILPDFPFKKHNSSYGTFRHPENDKWFALIMNIKWNKLIKNKDETEVYILNVKVDNSKIDELRKKNGIYYGYHMNSKYWISIVLDETLKDYEILELIDESFKLTK